MERRIDARSASAREIFQSLQSLTGKQLLVCPPIQNLLTYANAWKPFLSKEKPIVTKDSSGLYVSPETGAIALPHPFISPSTTETTKDATWQSVQFYWDTYFINKGLLLSGDPAHVDIAKGHIENFQYLFDRLGYIPNASRISIANRTQIPFLAGMIIDVYKTTGDKEWLKEKMEVAKREYGNWMMSDEDIKAKGLSHPSQRISKTSLLIRPVGRDIGKEHYPAAASTGEDDSAQWARRAYDYLPVTLNCALYKYESDFARAADFLGDPLEKAHWEGLTQRRKEEINKTFWNEKKGMYFDAYLNRKTGKWEQDARYYGLTGFMPLWVGLSTTDQAKKMVGQLPKFETPYGLTIAAKDSLPAQGVVRRQLRRMLLGKKYQRYDSAIEDIFSVNNGIIQQFGHLWNILQLMGSCDIGIPKKRKELWKIPLKD